MIGQILNNTSNVLEETLKALSGNGDRKEIEKFFEPLQDNAGTSKNPWKSLIGQVYVLTENVYFP